MKTSLKQRLAAKERDDRYFAYLNSFKTPLPYNPLRSARIARNLTFQELADKVGVSKQTLIRAEQGLFERPPEKLMKWLVNAGENELDLLIKYEEFQLLTRARHYRIFGDCLRGTKFHISDPKEHPLNWLLKHWVTGEEMNVTECAKLLCLSQAQLSHWLRNPSQKNVPAPLLNALLQNGYNKEEILVLVSRYNVYRGVILSDN